MIMKYPTHNFVIFIFNHSLEMKVNEKKLSLWSQNIIKKSLLTKMIFINFPWRKNANCWNDDSIISRLFDMFANLLKHCFNSGNMATIFNLKSSPNLPSRTPTHQGDYAFKNFHFFLTTLHTKMPSN